MIRLLPLSVAFFVWSCSGKPSNDPPGKIDQKVRVASFNIALASLEPDGVMRELESSSKRIDNIAKIIQLVSPDILFIQELQYDPEGKHLQAFKEHYLEVDQGKSSGIFYPYCYHFPTNAGHLTGFDLNRDSNATGPYDAHGWGTFPDQFALAIFSKFPIDTSQIRTFKDMKWKDLPNPHRPSDPETNDHYWSQEAWNSILLSSKNHIDVPIAVGKDTLHLIGAHPQGAGGDGPELRNTLKNFDEIKFLAHYISGTPFKDDQGRTLAFDPTNYFVVAGDLNSHPSLRGNLNDLAVEQLLNHPYLHPEATWGNFVPKSNGAIHPDAPSNSGTGKHFRTQFTAPSNFNQAGVRIDYVLPSRNLEISGSGVFWPSPTEDHYELTKDNSAGSDHRLVYVDIILK